MMIATLTLALALSTGTLLVAGYLFGARRGVLARDGLAHELAGWRERCGVVEQDAAAVRQHAVALEDQLSRTHSSSTEGEERLRRDLERARAQLLEHRQALDAAHRETHTARRTLAVLEQRTVDEGRLLAELQKQLEPLRREHAERDDQHQQLHVLLAPLMERERLAQALAHVELSGSDREALGRLMDTLAEVGGFATVLVSDEVGLPLASNRHAIDPDIRAGISALLLTLVDRVEANGQPPPIAAVLRDEDNQVILHRVFHIDAARYVLTAVAKGTQLAPDTLDPALTALERVLARPLAASA
jgi:hypothetical protein